MRHTARGRQTAEDPFDHVVFTPSVVETGAESAVEDLQARPALSRAVIVLLCAMAGLLVAGLVVAARTHDHHTTTTAPPGVAPPPRAIAVPDLSLASLRHYVLDSVEMRAGQQVLRVDYEPTPDDRYEAGTITLYARHVMAARAFTATARRVTVRGHVAYFGPYHHQQSLAWPVGAGRWVCLSGFIGTGVGSDPALSRAEELTVAEGVIVQ